MTQRSISQQHQSLIELMSRQYAEIRSLETEYGIFGQEGDFRPRIEYYHDAVRAFTSQSDDGLTKQSRLSVERLAYDVAMLRHIQAKPLHAGRGQQHFSVGTGVAARGKDGNYPDPGREIRGELQQLYKDYTVLFVALLSEKADRNTQSRLDEMSTAVSDLATLQELLSKLAKGEADMGAVLAAIEQLEMDDLRRAMKSLVAQGKMSAAAMASVKGKLSEATQGIAQEEKALDTAAHQFATGKLAVYEEARDTVKRLAASGMNVAGKFVEGAIAQSSAKQRGR
ncbi:MAG: hypothetical protein U1E36_06845 [Rickettsiales bacterium]